MMLSQLSQPSVPAQTCRSEALFSAWDSFFVPFSNSPPLTCGFAAVPCPTPKGERCSWDSGSGGAGAEVSLGWIRAIRADLARRRLVRCANPECRLFGYRRWVAADGEFTCECGEPIEAGTLRELAKRCLAEARAALGVVK